MKTVVDANIAWACTVLSVFAILILGPLAYLYESGHEEFAGSRDDPAPEELPAVSGAIYSATFIYMGFFVFCGLQGLIHVRNNRSGAGEISL